ncbi:MAG TPA: HAD family phosphatase, partial [Clostridiales bacterium]|nr:HAD family phosphatase [Clostridiales bacterium]
MFEAVIFDMDGVIIDSEPIHMKSDLMLLKEFGIEAEDGVLNRYVGIADMEMWEDLRERFNIGVSVDDIMVKSIINKKRLFTSIELQPVKGIRELLHELKGKKLGIGLASSSPVEIIQLILQRLEIREYFDVIVSGQQVERSKPDPEIFIKAAGLLGKRPENCIVVED